MKEKSELNIAAKMLIGCVLAGLLFVLLAVFVLSLDVYEKKMTDRRIGAEKNVILASRRASVQPLFQTWLLRALVSHYCDPDREPELWPWALPEMYTNPPPDRKAY